MWVGEKKVKKRKIIRRQSSGRGTMMSKKGRVEPSMTWNRPTNPNWNVEASLWLSERPKRCSRWKYMSLFKRAVRPDQQKIFNMFSERNFLTSRSNSHNVSRMERVASEMIHRMMLSRESAGSTHTKRAVRSALLRDRTISSIRWMKTTG